MARSVFARHCIALLVVTVSVATGCSKQGSTASNPSNPFSSTKFRIQEVVDAPQGGLLAFRFAVPQDWKADGRVEWHYNDLYTPMRTFARAGGGI